MSVFHEGKVNDATHTYIDSKLNNMAPISNGYLPKKSESISALPSKLTPQPSHSNDAITSTVNSQSTTHQQSKTPPSNNTDPNSSNQKQTNSSNSNITQEKTLNKSNTELKPYTEANKSQQSANSMTLSTKKSPSSNESSSSPSKKRHVGAKNDVTSKGVKLITNSAAAQHKRPCWSQLFSSKMINTVQDPYQELLSRGMAALLKSRDINANNSSFSFLTMLAEEYLTTLILELKQAANAQRRNTPGIADTMVLLHLSGLHLRMLDEELEAENKHKTSLPIEWNEIQVDFFDKEEKDTSKAFIQAEKDGLKKLLPNTFSRDTYVPSWMPQFPPEHTFRNTPSHPNRVTNPKILREMIVKEGQMAEQALRRLTGVVKVDENATIIEDADEEIKEELYPDAEGEQKAATNNRESSSSGSNDSASSSLSSSSGMDVELIYTLKQQTPQPQQTLTQTGTATLKLLSPSISSNPPTPPKQEKLQDQSMSVQVSSSQETNNNNNNNNNLPDIALIEPDNSDIFGLHQTPTKPFDLMKHVQARAKLLSKRKKKMQDNAQKEQRRTALISWHNQLILNSKLSADSPSSSSSSSSSSSEDKKKKESLSKSVIAEPPISCIEYLNSPSGLGPVPSIVEREYNAALTSISRSRRKITGTQQDIADTGTVNWERYRYI